jgi:hypothetical protein
MTWRVLLPHPVIRRIDILSGEKTVVAVWTQPDRVHFFDQRNGAALGERVIEKLAFTDRTDERWRLFLKGLVAPNGLYLPYVRAHEMTILVTEDGRVRLLQAKDAALFLEIDGVESAFGLAGEAAAAALDMDRQQGSIAVLDAQGRLHLFRQRLSTGSHDTGLQIDTETQPRVLAAQEGRRIVVTDGQSLVVMDEAGKVRKRLELHYALGGCTISPDGKWIAASDAETGVVRVYDGEQLAPSFQRFAIDLAADARRLNSGAGMQPSTVSPGILALTNRGVLAFALGALLCVTSVTRMRPVPQSSAN